MAVITKSYFTRGDNCPLATVNSIRFPEEASQPDINYVLDNGKRVGVFARELFPNHVTVEYGKYNERANETEKLILHGHKYICEASFHKDGLFASVDILHVCTDNHVEVFEVKSATKVKDIFYRDIAFQVNLIERCGYIVDAAYLVMVNNNFVKEGVIDPKKFFVIKDVSEDIHNLQPIITAELERIKEILEKGLEIDPPPFGEQCFKPYACQYWHKCKLALPKYSIFDIKGGMRVSTKVKHFYNGVQDMSALLTTRDLNPKFAQQARMEIEGSNETEVEMEELKNFLSTLSFPLISIDFETIIPAIPVFDGMSPYAQIVTQFSVHILREYGGKLQHYEFLADPKEDWRSLLAHELVKCCPETGSVIVWNKKMESPRIEEMSMMPCNEDIKDKLLSLKERIVDLMVPFQKRVVYNRLMHGSYSLKYVLPALCPNRKDLQYSDLSINNGMLASLVFSEIMYGEMSEFQTMATRKDLLTYCELDTFGPFHIINRMYQLKDQNAKPLFIVDNKRDNVNRTIRVGDYVTANIGNGTVIGFTPCFVKVRLDTHNRTILRMAHNLYNNSGILKPELETKKVPSNPSSVYEFFDVTGTKVRLGDYVVTRAQLGQVVGHTDYFLKICLKDGKEVLRNGTFVIIR